MRGLVCATLALLLAGTGMVNASQTSLLLEVWINGRTQHRVVRVETSGDAVYCDAVDLAGAGLRLHRENGLVALGELDGISFKIDIADQRLVITAPVDRLPEQSFDLRPPAAMPKSTSATGASLTYDLSATVNDVARPRAGASAGGQFGLTFFAQDTLFTATGFASAGLAQESGARLGTSLEFDDPSLPRRFIAGDAIAGSFDWSRAFRFGGFEFASDYALRPDLITFPLPSFFGRASVPETVDVLVGSSKVFEENLDEGPFSLHNLPIVTGGGSATVVTTDMLGRQTSETVSLYTTTNLLAPGLADYSFDAGFLRYGYGEESFGYRTPVASVVYRRGFDGFTAGAHAEAAPSLALAGAELAFALGGFGALSAAGALSDHGGKPGALAAFNLQAHAGPFNGFASVQSTGWQYQDVAGLEDGAPPRLRMQLGASAALPYGSLGLSWIRQSRSAEGNADEAIASYSLSAGKGWFVNLTGLRDFSGHHWTAEIFLGVPVGNGIASASYSGGSGRTSDLAAYSASANPDGGFGYSVLAGADGTGARAEGDATWVGDRAVLDASVATDGGETAMRADAAGALVFLNGEMFATRQPDGAMALVETGAPDVRVYRDNRTVAVSDANGEALLTGLVPYTENHIAIDPRDYAMSSLVASTERSVSPQRESAAIVDLAPRRAHGALVLVRFADGTAPPLGTLVKQSGGEATLAVGRDGEIFIPDLTQDEELILSVGDQGCVVSVKRPPRALASIPRIGPLLCALGVPA